jgi:hypothetical protein
MPLPVAVLKRKVVPALVRDAIANKAYWNYGTLGGLNANGADAGYNASSG